MRKADNPYLPFTSIPSRDAPALPAWVTSRLNGIMKGRNLEDLRTHFQDMEKSLDKRSLGALKASLTRGAGRGVAKAPRPSSAPAPPGVDPTRSPPLLYGRTETLAFVAHRMAPLFGVGVRVLDEVAAALPHWKPHTMLDFGTGPGSAICAAREVWEESVMDVVAVEPSRSMTQVAEHLLHDFSGVMYRRSLAEVRRFHKRRVFDLVVSHQTLSELCSDAERRGVVRELWDRVAPGGCLVITERGNKWGFRVVRVARQQLLSEELDRQATAFTEAGDDIEEELHTDAGDLDTGGYVDGGDPAALGFTLQSSSSSSASMAPLDGLYVLRVDVQLVFRACWSLTALVVVQADFRPRCRGKPHGGGGAVPTRIVLPHAL